MSFFVLGIEPRALCVLAKYSIIKRKLIKRFSYYFLRNLIWSSYTSSYLPPLPTSLLCHNPELK
jgi:hypothetical protein